MGQYFLIIIFSLPLYVFGASSDQSWIYGKWALSKSTLIEGSSKNDQKVELKDADKELVFEERVFRFKGKSCKSVEKYEVKKIPVDEEEGIVPDVSLRGTAWFLGQREDHPKEIELIFVYCKDTKVRYGFEKLDDKNILMVGKSVVLHFRKK